jgi:small GTP-binding protein
MPKEMRQWRGLIDRAVEHLRMAAGGKHRVAIVGPTNVGKSTLYNQLIRSRSDRSAVSAVPGTTREAREADAGIFGVIDTPGADAAGAVGVEEKRRALEAASQADVLVVMFDASHGVGAADQALFRELVALERPTVVGLNKIDLVRGERAAVIARAAGSLGIPADQMIPLSAKEGSGVERIIMAVAKTEPEIVAALGEALPEYRGQLARATVIRAASTAAVIAITPLPMIDFIPLVAVQSAMVIALARIYAYRMTAARARELIATFGLGYLGRTLFYELAKLGGPPGWLVGAAVASGTTVAIGYGAAAWFERRQRLSPAALGEVSRAVSQAVVERLRGLGRRRPRGITLRERVGQVLEELPPEGGRQAERPPD